MRIAFYAPLKPPTDPDPSGDRLIARLFVAALEGAGHEVGLASRFRSFDLNGDEDRQARIRETGGRLAERVLRRFQTAGPGDKPDLWFTYHLYRKAPDWIGPAVAAALEIPYVVAEASVAPKHASGPWSEGYAAVNAALRQADRVIGLTEADAPCVLAELEDETRYRRLKPFLDGSRFFEAPPLRAQTRAALAARHGIDPNIPWLLTVAMMRPGVKMQSYEVLAAALAELRDLSWHHLVVGSGSEEERVRSLFAPLEGRVTWLGARDPSELPGIYAASDVFVWPSVRESPGMSFLEAQAVGIPVVGGDGGGVPDVIKDGISGYLTPRGDAQAFADATRRLILDGELRKEMGTAARASVRDDHDLVAMSDKLGRILAELAP